MRERKKRKIQLANMDAAVSFANYVGEVTEVTQL